MIEIKTANSEDFLTVQELILTALREDTQAFTVYFTEYAFASNDWWTEYLKNYLSQNSSKLFIAFEDNRAVGMVGTIYTNKRKMSHVAYIVWFFVAKQHRGKGMGKKLMQEVMNDIQNHEMIRKIVLNVTSTQKDAISIYKKNGFVEVGLLKEELLIEGKYYDVVVMEKYLLRD